MYRAIFAYCQNHGGDADLAAPRDNSPNKEIKTFMSATLTNKWWPNPKNAAIEYVIDKKFISFQEHNAMQIWSFKDNEQRTHA